MAYSFYNEQLIKKEIKKKQDRMLRNSLKMVSSPMSIEIGWFYESGKYPESEGGQSVSYVAQIHEFGLGPHSPKGFVRITIDSHQKEWYDIFQSRVNIAVKNALKGKGSLNSFDKHFLLLEIGNKIKRDLQDTITEINLIDTTRLKNSIIIKFDRR